MSEKGGYCELHTEENIFEEGEGCPLCECMNNKADIIERWAKDRKTLTARLEEAVEIIDRIEGKSGIDCPICTGGINGWGHVQACQDLQKWAKQAKGESDG